MKCLGVRKSLFIEKHCTEICHILKNPCGLKQEWGKEKCFEKVRTIQQYFFSKGALRLAGLKKLLIFLLLEEIKKEKWDGLEMF